MPSVYSAKSVSGGLRRIAGAGAVRCSRGATSRIKDLANIEGVRQNQLIGYGLVVGLNGTGDTLNNIPFTKQSLQAMLERMGVNIRGATIRTGNVAAVMVTGNLPPFGTQGTRMDVTVSALGDSKNLQGGTLLVTPLLGADGNVYAVAQGSVAIGGFQAEGEAAKIVRGVPTVGRIANGAIIEREIEFALNRLPNVRLALRNADFTTAKRIAAAVNDYLGAKTAEPIDPSTVQLSIPPEFKGNVVAFLTEIEQLQVEPDLAAKIVIDERSGIIVMGRDVRVATVAVAQGNLTVTISESPQVSQPNPLSRGRTVVTPRTASRCRRRQEARAGERRRIAAAAGRRPQRARHRPARPDRHPAGDQGRRRDPGRHRGDVMQPTRPPSTAARRQTAMPTYHGRPDLRLADALTKVSPQAQAKAKATATDFEAMFLNQMFSQMTSGLKGEGPFGDTRAPACGARC
jgi:flagellar P-ring protein precursor FlgI